MCQNGFWDRFRLAGFAGFNRNLYIPIDSCWDLLPLGAFGVPGMQARSSAVVAHALSRGRGERLLPWSVANSRWVRAGRIPLCEALSGLLKQSPVAPGCRN